MATRARRTVALVESPVQVLNTIEWAAHHQVQHDTLLLILPSREPTTRAQLGAMSRLARAEGLATVWREPRLTRTSPIDVAWSLRELLDNARRIVVGDPFSRYIQLLLALTSAHQLVVVDDGTATIEYLDQIRAGQRLRRWHSRVRGPRDLVADTFSRIAHQRLTPGPHRAIEVFTAMSVDPPWGMEHYRNTYAWVRSAIPPPQVRPGTDVLGTSLVETGVVDNERYVDGIRELTLSTGAGRYYAHRRETAAKLAQIADRTGLEIVRPGLPLEVEARRGPVSASIVSFPSTVVYTLPLVLQDVAVRISVCDVPDSWLTQAASGRASGFLHEVSSHARHAHGLRSLAAPTGA